MCPCYKFDVHAAILIEALKINPASKRQEMAAYAAVVSLMLDLEQLMSPDSCLGVFDLEKIDFLYKELGFLESILRNYKARASDSLKDLERQIKNVARKAEDFIDIHVYNASLPEESELISDNSLPQIIEEISSINTEITKICDATGLEAESSFISKGPSQRESSSEDNLVGVDEDVEKILDRLTGFPDSLEVISVVGMGGIGKTSLVRTIFKHPLVVHHFYIPLWAKVSQNYRVREILESLVLSISQPKIPNPTDEQLGEQLYRCLKGNRYLIVLDDMWDTSAWDDLRRYFPDDANGSRIVLTTRLYNVAVYASKNSTTYSIRFRALDESWKIFCGRLFGNGSCPLEIEKIGKKIVRKCQGLPLVVVVVAGLLSNMSMTVECWEEIAESVSSLVTDDPESCLEILALSYNHLPLHLKACFLYMAFMPQNTEISVQRLIWLWISEGCLRCTGEESLEEKGEQNLKELIDKNLVLVRVWECNKKAKMCYLHDIIRDVCLREALREDFLHVTERCDQIPLISPDIHRRLFLHLEILDYVCLQPSLRLPFVRSLLCLSKDALKYQSFHLVWLADFSPENSKFLKVLSLNNLFIMLFNAHITLLVHLRFLEINIEDCISFPASIANLRNLRTLVVHVNVGIPTLPCEIWKMLNLRHLCVEEQCYLPDPPRAESDEIGSLGLQNLQVQSRISLRSCTKEVLSRISNLRQLAIRETIHDKMSGEISLDHIANLSCLFELEKLICLYNILPNPNVARRYLPTHDTFPPKLKELALGGSYLQWENMSILGMLPNLEVLVLAKHAFWGQEWEQNEEGFPKLKYLLIGETNLKTWVANCIPFQNLGHLVLNSCKSLYEIPCEVGEIPTLEVIELQFCSESAADSAKTIKEELERMGNDKLLIITDSACTYRYKSSYRLFFLPIFFSLKVKILILSLMTIESDFDGDYS